MKYRGLGRGARIVLWATFAVVVASGVMASAPGAIESLTRITGTEREALPWFATRVLAWLSYLALAGSVVYGLLLSTGLLDIIAQRTVSFTLHQDLAAVGLALGTWHAVLLAIDRSVPFSLLEVALPFTAPYRPLWVGLGQVGLYLSLLLIVSFYVRRRIGQRTWRRLHHVSFVAFVALTLHGIMSGTDSGATWALAIYLSATALVVFLLTYRVAISLIDRVRRPGAATPSRAAATGAGSGSTQGRSSTSSEQAA